MLLRSLARSCARKDGKRKIRAVDNFSWSAQGNSKKAKKSESVNGHCVMGERITHDHLDTLMEVVKLFLEYVVMRHCFCGHFASRLHARKQASNGSASTPTVPCLWKADIDSAFRCYFAVCWLSHVVLFHVTLTGASRLLAIKGRFVHFVLPSSLGRP